MEQIVEQPLPSHNRLPHTGPLAGSTIDVVAEPPPSKAIGVPQSAAETFSEPVTNLLAEPDDDVEWIVEGLFAVASNGFIGAEPKVGKSWLGLLLAVCVSAGLPFLGFAVPASRAVLYVQEEDSRRRVRGACQ